VTDDDFTPERERRCPNGDSCQLYRHCADGCARVTMCQVCGRDKPMGTVKARPRALDGVVQSVFACDDCGRGCPDGGHCHHGCDESCWRVSFCEPLSAYGGDWTDEDKAANANPPRRIEGFLVTGLEQQP
jgi:hypothetical protein